MLKRNLVTLGFLTVVAWGANSPQTNLKLSELQIQVDKVKKEIEFEEKTWAEEKAREVDAEKKRRERYESFVSEKQELERSIAHVDQQIQERMNQIERLKVRGESIEGQIKFLRSVILEESRDYLDLIQKGFPYRVEKRLETIQLLVDDVLKERVSPEEGFNRLWVQYISEHNAASEAEIYSGQAVLDDGKSIAVKYLRVGKQVIAYINPAGDQMGIMIRSSNGPIKWMREGEMDFNMRSIVRNALAVAEGKALPGFVQFPFWLSSFETNSEEVK